MAIPLRPEAGTWISPAAGIALGYRRLEYYNHYRYHESLGNLTPPTSTPVGTAPSLREAERSKT